MTKEFYIIPYSRLGNMLYAIGLGIIFKDKYPDSKIFFNIEQLYHHYKNKENEFLKMFTFWNDSFLNFSYDDIKKNDKCVEFNMHIIDFNKIIDNDILLFKGYFQRTEYYFEYRDLIKKNISNNIYEQSSNNYLTIHLRSGDCWGKGTYGEGKATYWGQPVLPISYYENIISDENNIKIITESLNDPILLKLKNIYKNRNLKIQSKNVCEDFKELVNAERLILSVSTFSWWGAFLSNAKEIHIPESGNFCKNTHGKTFNWRFPENDPVFIYHELPEHPMFTEKKWKGTQEQLNFLLNN